VNTATTAKGIGAPDSSRSNAAMLSSLYDAFATGDLETARQFVSPDFVLHVPGTGRNAGEYWGPDGFLTFLSNVATHNGGLFDLQVPAFAVNGEHGFSREVVRINRAHDPERLWTLRISNWFVVRNGKLSELWVIPEDQRMYDEYWGRGPDVPRRGATIPQRIASRGQLVDASRATCPENVELLSAMYAHVWNNDWDAMRRLIADGVIVNIVGRSAISGVYHGWNGYKTFRQKLMGLAGPKYKLNVTALAASPRDVFVVEHLRMNRQWDAAVQTIYVLMHFEVEDGRITRMDDFPIDTYAWERFYTPPTR
jgi:ketosteroid isomerase-like protein